MRKLFFFFLAFVALGACNRSTQQKVVVRQEKKQWVHTEKCFIWQSYPQIEGLADTLVQDRFNDFLLKVNRIQEAAVNCENDTLDRYRAMGSYFVRSLNDSLLSLEIWSQYEQNKDYWVHYYPITVRLPDLHFLSLEQQLGPQIWAQIDPFLKRWAQHPEHTYNEEAYHSGTRTVINYTLTPDSLILFPGSEGEGVAMHRLSIGLNQL